MTPEEELQRLLKEVGTKLKEEKEGTKGETIDHFLLPLVMDVHGIFPCSHYPITEEERAYANLELPGMKEAAEKEGDGISTLLLTFTARLTRVFFTTLRMATKLRGLSEDDRVYTSLYQVVATQHEGCLRIPSEQLTDVPGYLHVSLKDGDLVIRANPLETGDG